MSNKFNFIDAISLKYANNVISKIENYDVIDEIIYEQPEIEKVTKTEKVTPKNDNSANFVKKVDENVDDLVNNNVSNPIDEPIILPDTSNNVDSQTDQLPAKFYQKSDKPISIKKLPQKQEQSKGASFFSPNVVKKSNLTLPNKTINDLTNSNSGVEKNNVVANKPLVEEKVNKSIEEKPMKDFNSNNVYQFTSNDQTNSKNLENDTITLDSVPMSVVDTLNNDYDINSINNLDNIVNINDVYDDLGKTFQDDLFNQYDKLDKYVNYEETPKYSYLPKRRIRDLLSNKYNITNEECINDLYSMAFNNKWKEIDLEHWLLNPANISALKSKYGIVDVIKEKSDLIENKEIPVSSEAKSQKAEPIVNETKEASNTQRVEIVILREDQNAKNAPIKKEHHNHNHHELDKHQSFDCDHNYHIKNKHKHYFYNDYYSSNSVKDDLKSVLIEENYRKMQFDFQTEILKNHIDSKFSNSVNFNSNYYQPRQNRFYENNLDSNYIPNQFYNSQIEETNNRHSNLEKSNKDELNNKSKAFSQDTSNYLSIDDFDKKIADIFKEEKSKIKEEIHVEISELKEKFVENEKNIYESLDFLRKEIRENEKILKSDLNDSLNGIRSEIANNLSIYLQEMDKKQEQLTEVIQNKQNEFLDKVTSLNKENDLIPSSKFEEQLKNNFTMISEELSLLKGKINSQTIDNSNEIKELRSSINDQLNVVSEEMKNSILNIYSEIDALSEYVYNKEQNQYTEDSVISDEQEEEYIENLRPKVETFDNDFGVIETIRTNDNSFDIPNYDNYKLNTYVNTQQESNHKSVNESQPSTKSTLVDYESFANNELQNANFDFLNKDDTSLKNESRTIQENNDEYDEVTLTKEDKDFYSQFLNDDKNNINNTIISNFDSNQTVNSLDVENTINISNVQDQETKNSDDIKAKLSRIDEIIKNSIDELNDIKDYVKEDDAKIDESIKLFEKVK